MGADLGLIQDLALILFCAATMSILFKKLNQPVVLGYIVAGFLAGPHMPYTETITDIESIKIWAEIGVIFILFGLGLEFSFKKLFKIGSTPVIAVTTSLLCMTGIGVAISYIFGWGLMTGFFLGGMLAMSSTSVIIKSFDDLGVKHQKFATTVFSVLILEDLIAIVLMMLFNMLGADGKVDGEELLFKLLIMGFYLVLWFVMGIYIIPLILKWCKKFMNNEMLLILSLALCFLMVILANEAGFSASFGAFVMGSILAETTESEHIEKVVTPIKDLFGAIFFVSVGMMIDPAMLVQYWLPIVVLVLVMLFLRSTVDSTAFMLGGLSIKDSVKSGYSLAQVGEFAFILAAVGVSTGVMEKFMYPVIVCVSVITTFTTPLMIKISDPIGTKLELWFPERLKRANQRNEAENDIHVSHSSSRKFIKNSLIIMLIYSVLSLFIVLLCDYYLYIYLESVIPADWWGSFIAPMEETNTIVYDYLAQINIVKLATVTVALVALLLFIRPLLVTGLYTTEFENMWNNKNTKHAPVVFVILLRHLLAILLLTTTIGILYKSATAIIGGIIFFIFMLLISRKRLNTHINKIESVFKENYNAKENAKRPKYAGKLVESGIHLSEVTIPSNSKWCGTSILDTQWGKNYDVHIVSIIREEGRINIPEPTTIIYPNDKIQLLGSDVSLAKFAQAIAKKENQVEIRATTAGDILILSKVTIPETSVFVGMTIANCNIREEFHCMIAGIDHGNGETTKPVATEVICAGDFILVVGESKDIKALQKKANMPKAETVES